MTIIENLGPNHDLIRYSNINGEEKLIYSKDGSETPIIVFKGNGENYLFRTVTEVSDFLDSKGITTENLGSSDNELFKLSYLGNRNYSIEVSDRPDLKLNFETSVDPISQGNLDSINSLISDFLLSNSSAYKKYLEFFKKSYKEDGFLVRTDGEPEWMMVIRGDDHELFMPKNDESSYWLRAYFSKELDNHSIDLSYKKYGVESDIDLGIYDFYAPIPKEALIELELEDKRVVYLDLFDGVDLENGISVKDKNISSQRVIKNIRIYYEINQSPEYR